MLETLALFGTALWLGILTSISPCPLATNIAAITYIGRDVNSARRVFSMGALYALGRSLSYVVLGVILVGSLVNAPGLSQFLQKYMNLALGPLMVLAGMVLLGMIEIGGSGRGVSEGSSAGSSPGDCSGPSYSGPSSRSRSARSPPGSSSRV